MVCQAWVRAALHGAPSLRFVAKPFVRRLAYVGPARSAPILLKKQTSRTRTGGAMGKCGVARSTCARRGRSRLTLPERTAFALGRLCRASCGRAIAKAAELALALALTLAASACGGGGDASTAAPAGMSAGAATYSVGGSVSGLGPGLSLQLLNNGGDAVTVGGNGGFRFPGKLSAGATYAATVGTRPSGQQCTIDKGSGTVANADVADIAVTCSARPLFAYVANADDNTVQAFALDPATGAATGVGRPAAVGHGPVSLVADPAGTTLYVVNASDNTVTTLAIHPDTGAVSVSAPAVRTGASPLSIARTPAGPFAYTANAGDNTLSIFKMSAKAEAPAPRGVVQAGSNPYTVAVNGTGTFAYVVNAAMVSGAPSVMAFAINGATGALVPAGSPAATGHAPFFIALHPAGRFAYVANFADDTLSVYAINGATGALAPAGSPVATGGNPFAIAIHPSGRFAYVANVFSGTISLFAIDARTGALTPIGTVQAGASPVAMTLNPAGTVAYVLNAGDDTMAIYRVDGGTGVLSAVATVQTGLTPSAMAIVAVP
ncbi:YncE family protein [Ralstonia solanacearum]